MVTFVRDVLIPIIFQSLDIFQDPIRLDPFTTYSFGGILRNELFFKKKES